MATKITSGSIFSAGAVVTGVDADAPPAVPSPSPEPAPATATAQILPLSRAVSLLMDASATADGSVVDSSANSHSITTHGDVSQSSYSPYRSGGYSWEFTGQGNYLSVPNSDGSSDYDFRDVDFTVEFFMNLNGSNHSNNPVIMGGQQGWYVQLKNTDSRITFYDNAVEHHAEVTLDNSSWYHVAITRSGSTVKTFLNGSEVYSGSASTSNGRMYNSDFLIASYATNTNLAYIGLLSDIRVVKGTALYTESFTAPTERLTEVSGTSLLACNLPYLQSGLTAHGDVSPVAAGPYDYAGYSESLHGGSYVFDGSSRLTLSSQMHVSGEFAIEAWVHLDDNYSDPYVCGTLDDGNIQILRIHGGYPYFTHRNYQSFSDVTAGTITDGGLRGDTLLKSGQWYHLALTRDASNTLRIFVNGQVDAAATWSHGFNFNTIGALTSGNGHMQGSMSDFRVVLNTPVYTEAFTPSTAPLTAVAGTSLLLSGNNASIRDESQSVESISVFGNTTVSEDSPFFTYGEANQTQYSYTFDGDGDYIRADAALSSFTSSTQPFTIEKYVKFNSLIGDCFVTSLNAVSNGYNNLLIGHYGSQWRLNTNGGNNDFGTIQTGVWYHVAVVYEGGSSDVKVYIDGQLKTTRSWGRPALNVNTLLIGADADAGNAGNLADWIDGEIRDYRISSTAVYTENFTPAALSLTSDTEFYLSPSVSTITDASTNNHPLTVHGNVYVVEENVAPKIYTGKSIQFDGSGDYIRADEALDSFTSTTDPFTIEFWMIPERFNDSMAVDVPFAINSIATGSNELIFVGKNHTDPSRGQYVTLDGSNTNPSYTLGVTLQDNGPWYHIAMTYDGTTFKLYVDGTVAISQNVAFTIPFADCSLLIGADADSANAGSLGNYYKGKLSSIRISERVIYTENFTVPSAPLGDYSETVASPEPAPSIVTEGLVFHVDAGNTSSYSGSGTTWTDLTGSNDATLVNGVTYDNGSMVFDGVDDYVTVPSTLTIGDTFTYSSWINANSLSGRSAIFSTRNPNSGDGLWQLEVGEANGPNRVGISIPGVWAYTSSDNVISTNTWHHITVVKADASTNFEVFVDGVSQGFASLSVSTSGNNNTRVIGAGVNAIYDFFDGKMSSIVMYDKALTAEEIQTNMTATQPF